ncbi:MAG: hypothetical protein N2545_01130 [Thermoflexales bacterium]|nr:hypothetical protein [Thermoflexales bacterium]
MSIFIRRTDGGYMFNESIYVFTNGLPRVFPEVPHAERYIAAAKAAAECGVEEALVGEEIVSVVHRRVYSNGMIMPTDDEVKEFIALVRALPAREEDDHERD